MILRLVTNIGRFRLEVYENWTLQQFIESIAVKLRVEIPTKSPVSDENEKFSLNICRDISGNKPICIDSSTSLLTLGALGLKQGDELFVIDKFEEFVIEKDYVNDNHEVVKAGKILKVKASNKSNNTDTFVSIDLSPADIRIHKKEKEDMKTIDRQCNIAFTEDDNNLETLENKTSNDVEANQCDNEYPSEFCQPRQPDTVKRMVLVDEIPPEYLNLLTNQNKEKLGKLRMELIEAGLSEIDIDREMTRSLQEMLGEATARRFEYEDAVLRNTKALTTLSEVEQILKHSKRFNESISAVNRTRATKNNDIPSSFSKLPSQSFTDSFRSSAKLSKAGQVSVLKQIKPSAPVVATSAVNQVDRSGICMEDEGSDDLYDFNNDHDSFQMHNRIVPSTSSNLSSIPPRTRQLDSRSTAASSTTTNTHQTLPRLTNLPRIQMVNTSSSTSKNGLFVAGKSSDVAKRRSFSANDHTLPSPRVAANLLSLTKPPNSTALSYSTSRSQPSSNSSKEVLPSQQGTTVNPALSSIDTKRFPLRPTSESLNVYSTHGGLKIPEQITASTIDEQLRLLQEQMDAEAASEIQRMEEEMERERLEALSSIAARDSDSYSKDSTNANISDRTIRDRALSNSLSSTAAMREFVHQGHEMTPWLKDSIDASIDRDLVDLAIMQSAHLNATHSLSISREEDRSGLFNESNRTDAHFNTNGISDPRHLHLLEGYDEDEVLSRVLQQSLNDL